MGRDAEMTATLFSVVHSVSHVLDWEEEEEWKESFFFMIGTSDPLQPTGLDEDF